MTVYLDLVMLLNFLVDLFLLIGTNRLSGYPVGIMRCVLGAAFGGVYSGACLLPGFHFLGNSLWRMISLLLMSGLAFGFRRSALHRAGMFLILSMALGGIALSFGRGALLPLLCCGGILWILCQLGFSDVPRGRQYEQVVLHYGDKTISLVALRDTGNTLRDPVTGEQVLVVSSDIAKKLTGLTLEQLRNPLDTMTRKAIPGLRLVPYRTISGSGMLLALRLQEVKISGKTMSGIVAFATDGLDRENVYQALTGGVL